MSLILQIITIIVSILIILLILIQGRGAGLGSAWGGSGERFQSRRGIEKWMMRATVLFIVVFLIITLTGLIL